LASIVGSSLFLGGELPVGPHTSVVRRKEAAQDPVRFPRLPAELRSSH
jgi:hypothetical protein